MAPPDGNIHTNLDPLPLTIRDGMIAMGIVGVISSISTLTLLIFIAYRAIFWRRYYEYPIHANQIIVLIYNLLLADFQQALSFVFSFYWISQNKLVGPSHACFAQGWLIQIGDVSSGLFVLAIAVHTFVNLVIQKPISHKIFATSVLAIWAFCLFLTMIGPILSKDDFFIPAGAWCWFNETHENERLYLHYLWIFIAQGGALTIYISVFFYLRGQLAKSSKLQISSVTESVRNATGPYKGKGTTTTTIFGPSNANDSFAASRQRIMRTARYMVVYPFAYVCLTLPLATGRISSMAGRQPPLVFFPIAGTLMASCGIIDVVLYLTTRKALVRGSLGVKGSSSGRPRFGIGGLLRRGPRSQSIRLGGLRDEGEEDRIPVGVEAPLDGIIVVSKSVFTTTDTFQSSAMSQRTDSLQSMSVGREEVPQSWNKL
ncbi:uncharacterized protein RSE6_04903 [Rhynchosporium secalis]|uniref:G protein-coupled receptor GPR1/2/3 C-terminal domain-containing protein n=1 Tax=Rhynchosporium secalis TaxID=38038 RepID=A0A1E1M6F9_RHYSE|nr:uncharacterized protein RSE6_04903 [Rhynchosporium secalis]